MNIVLLIRKLLLISGPKRLRLRHVLHLAVVLESRAAAFYRGAAELVKEDTGRELFTSLAVEDERRVQYMREMLDGWRKVRVTGWHLRRMDRDGSLRRSFDIRQVNGAGPSAVVAFAKKQEALLLEFYERVEQELVGDSAQTRSVSPYDSVREARLMWKSANLDTLVDASRKRVTRLSNLAPTYYRSELDSFVTSVESKFGGAHRQ
jgi:rubrerythrin